MAMRSAIPLLIVLMIGSPAVAQDAGVQDIPSSMIDGPVRAHIACLRNAERRGSGPSDAREALGPDPEPLPLIVSHARVIEFCHRERDDAILFLRASIKGRHPDWSGLRIDHGAEKALTLIELRMFEAVVRPEMTSHGPVEEF